MPFAINWVLRLLPPNEPARWGPRKIHGNLRLSVSPVAFLGLGSPGLWPLRGAALQTSFLPAYLSEVWFHSGNKVTQVGAKVTKLKSLALRSQLGDPSAISGNHKGKSKVT